LSDEFKEGFADLIWSQGEGLLQDTGRLRAYLADCVLDRWKRDVLLIAVTSGMADDITLCKFDDFSLNKLQWKKRLGHVAPGLAEWAIDTLSYTLGPNFDPKIAFAKGKDYQLKSYQEMDPNRSVQLRFRAINCFRIVAERADWEGAWSNLAWIYEGSPLHDYAQAEKCYEHLIAKSGRNVSDWHLKLGRFLLEHTTDYSAALNHFQVAANAGHAQAMFELGLIYENGKIVERDNQEAVKWFKAAAEKDDAGAILRLGDMCFYRRGIKQNFGQALAWYSRLLTQFPHAQRNMAYIWQHGLGTKQSLALAHEYYAMAAEQDPESQCCLAYLYERGLGIEQDLSVAEQWYSRAACEGNQRGIAKSAYLAFLRSELDMANLIEAYRRASKSEIDSLLEKDRWRPDDIRERAEKGNAQSQAILGHMYCTGDQVEQSFDTALKWYRLAAEQGKPGAECNLGVMYERGWGVDLDYSEAAKWYRIAADHGSVIARYNLAILYRCGKGVEQDIERSIELYLQLAADGSIRAQLALVDIYQSTEQGRAPDYVEAVRWCRRAADHGSARGQALLGGFYELGLGVEKDLTEAIRLYRFSAQQGDACGQFNLGDLYERGIGVEKDETEAAEWYREAAEQGHAHAQHKLGIMYQRSGAMQDLEKAYQWYSIAAELGLAEAQFDLGWIYATGSGVPRDYLRAKTWYLCSAEQGNSNAECNLGAMYQNGSGVEQDYVEAVKWYLRSAEQGNSTAACNLGAMYQNGSGVEQDDAEAVKWFTRSAEQGNSDAESNLDAGEDHAFGLIEKPPKTLSWEERISQAQGDEGWRLPLFCGDEDEWRTLASDGDLDESDYAVMFIAEQDRESLMGWLSEKLALYRYHPSALPVVIAYDDGYIAECAAKSYAPGVRATDWDWQLDTAYGSTSPFRTWQRGTLWELQELVHLLEKHLPRPADLRAEKENWEKELRAAGTWGEYNLQKHPAVEDLMRTKAIKRYLDRRQRPAKPVGAYFARCVPKFRAALESFS